MKFDLHMHSFYSDGRFSPEALVKKCRESNVGIMSLTDHESVRGIPEAIKAGRELGVKVIPAIELSSDYMGREHHILGYFIDYQSGKFNDFLSRQRASREEQIKGMVGKLKDLGFSIELNEVMSLVKDSVSRSHICDAILLHQERNSPLLERYGIKTGKELLKPLLEENGRAYVARKRPYIREIIDLIAEAGGVSVLAHPFWRADEIETIEKKLCQLRKFGLDGLEIGYPHHNEEKVRGLHRLANEFSMIESAGSDFHESSPKDIDRVVRFETHGIESNFPFGRLGGQ